MQGPIAVQSSRNSVRTEWTSRVVLSTSAVHVDERTGEKRSVFEELLNNAFAELLEEGWHVSTVQQMPDGFVVLASRVISAGIAPSSTTVFPDSEITAHYTWRVDGECHCQTFASLGEALRVASAHFKEGEKAPVSIHLTALTSYNRHDLWRLTNQPRK